MARAVIVLACLAGGCFHAPGYSPQRSLATWREMQATAPPLPRPRPPVTRLRATPA